MHLTGSPQRSKVGQFSSRDNLRLESPQNRFSGVVPVFPKLTTSIASLSSFPPSFIFSYRNDFPNILQLAPITSSTFDVHLSPITILAHHAPLHPFICPPGGLEARSP